MRLDWFREVLDLEARVRSTAQALDRLKTGALVAFSSGAVVLGLVGGGIWWLPAAMGGGLLAWRTGLFLVDLPEWRYQRQLKRWDELRTRIERLQQSRLDADARKMLGAPLMNELSTVFPRPMIEGPGDRQTE
jgi:hypothetical protein